jgi:hypothetical protein
MKLVGIATVVGYTARSFPYACTGRMHESAPTDIYTYSECDRAEVRVL